VNSLQTTILALRAGAEYHPSLQGTHYTAVLAVAVAC